MELRTIDPVLDGRPRRLLSRPVVLSVSFFSEPAVSLVLALTAAGALRGLAWSSMMPDPSSNTPAMTARSSFKFPDGRFGEERTSKNSLSRPGSDMRNGEPYRSNDGPVVPTASTTRQVWAAPSDTREDMSVPGKRAEAAHRRARRALDLHDASSAPSFSSSSAARRSSTRAAAWNTVIPNCETRGGGE